MPQKHKRGDFLRILAIDLGDERTGLAFSDISGSIPGEALVVKESNGGRLCEKICALAAERKVGAIALGHPVNMNGTRGPRAEKAAAFAEKLAAKSGIPVKLWDERRTTVEAHRILSESGKPMKKHKKTVDAVAAVLILEGYLAFLKNRELRTEEEK